MSLFQKQVKPLRNLDVIWICGKSDEIFEDVFSFEYCRKTSRELCETHLNINNWLEVSPGESIEKALELVTSDCFLVIHNPVLVTAPVAVNRMIQTLEKGFQACFPVYNETSFISQIAALPAIYLNLSTYLEVADMISQKEISFVGNISCPDTSCGLFKTEVLARIDSFDIFHEMNVVSLLFDLIDNNKSAIDRRALIHSFGVYGLSHRQELAALVPESANFILDVGCARGGFGEMMRKRRPDIELTGVEMNPVMAEQAVQHYDRIFTRKVEDIVFDVQFDHINCGDIIEHLYDPWQILNRFYSILKEGGTLVISLPNAGHWTIVRDLAMGDFPYLPFGLMCVTHIRWFTEKTIKAALASAGFKVTFFTREQVPPTPKGREFINMMCKNGYADKTSLLTNQFTLRAVRQR